VVFFRDDRRAFLEEPFTAAVITSPAPNAAELGRDPDADLRGTFERRAGHVLDVARHHGHRVLVLGAWGCGAFRNDPVMVADVFARALEARGGEFDHVVFAVFDPRQGQPNLTAFRRRFA
jgi:uncharacterized protein (TIGR02452 family)